jgi:hypothetical protein
MEQDIKKLKEISEVACYGKQLNKILDSSKQLALEINSSKLTSTISDDLNLFLHVHWLCKILACPLNLLVNSSKASAIDFI